MSSVGLPVRTVRRGGKLALALVLVLALCCCDELWLCWMAIPAACDRPHGHRARTAAGPGLGVG